MNKRGVVCFWACVVAAPLCGYLATVPAFARVFGGIHAYSMWHAVITGVVLGLAYMLIRPILRILTLPIGCLTLGLFGIVIDTVLVLAISSIRVMGFSVTSPFSALVVALVCNAMCVPVSMLGVGKRR